MKSYILHFRKKKKKKKKKKKIQLIDQKFQKYTYILKKGQSVGIERKEEKNKVVQFHDGMKIKIKINNGFKTNGTG